MITEQFDAIIVGAGISGLVTAYRLQQQGLKVIVLERGDTVGGVMRSEQREGYRLEWGPNSFLESLEANQLIQELDLTEQFVTANPRAPRYVYFRGRLNPVPMSLLAAITTPLLSPLGKLRILAEPLVWAGHGKEESIASFVRRRIGHEAHDRLVSPFISGVYAGNTEKLSIQASLPALANLEANYGSLFIGGIKSAFAAKKTRKSNNNPKSGKRLCSFKDGMQTLPLALARALGERVKLNCHITELQIVPVGDPEKAGERSKLKARANFAGANQSHSSTVISQSVDDQSVNAQPTNSQSLNNESLDNPSLNNRSINNPSKNSARYQMLVQIDQQSYTFSTDQLILATPADATAQLIESEIPALAQELREIEYAPIAIVYLSYRSEQLSRPLDGFGFLVPRTEGRRLLGSVWSSSLFPARAPQDRWLLTNFVGGAHDPQVLQVSDADLTSQIAREIQAIMGTTTPPEIVYVRKIARAIPQFNLGHLPRTKWIAEIMHGYPGLHLAGNYLRGVSVPDCISRGFALAAEITATGQ